MPSQLTKKSQQHQNRSSKFVLYCGGKTPIKILFVATICVISFFVGTLTGLLRQQTTQTGGHCEDELFSSLRKNSRGEEEEERKYQDMMQVTIQRRVDEELRNYQMSQSQSISSSSSSNKTTPPRFPPTLSTVATGAVQLPRTPFQSLLNYGSPLDTRDHNLLLLYQSAASLPKDDALRMMAVSGGEGEPFPEVNGEEMEMALETCDVLKVGSVRERVGRECLVLMEGYESDHVQRWLRVDDNDKFDMRGSLKQVGRGVTDKGQNWFTPPFAGQISDAWKIIHTFLKSRQDVETQLKPVLRRIAVNNTIVVMTVNFGQSALLMNFVCAAKSRGLDISNVLLFATDQESLDLARGMGLEAFYDEANFHNLPKHEARIYGDLTFQKMMFAKVISVLTVNSLGYNLLFQDVDVVWYRNPLPPFFDNTSPFANYDVIFQDDGAHSPRYAPYSANSGFYYVRYNRRTAYLFTSLLYKGELILKSKSHQQALIAVLAEHASTFGLRVKVIPLENTEMGEDFPGGWHYHRRREFLRQIAKEEVTPRIFHMSWTTNKNNKLLFMRQMGMWFLEDKCVDKTVQQIPIQNVVSDGKGKEQIDKEVNTKAKGKGSDVDLVTACCAAEPILSCHYRDKPSKIPCKDSPPIDKGRPSFW